MPRPSPEVKEEAMWGDKNEHQAGESGTHSAPRAEACTRARAGIYMSTIVRRARRCAHRRPANAEPSSSRGQNADSDKRCEAAKHARGPIDA